MKSYFYHLLRQLLIFSDLWHVYLFIVKLNCKIIIIIILHFLVGFKPYVSNTYGDVSLNGHFLVSSS